MPAEFDAADRAAIEDLKKGIAIINMASEHLEKENYTALDGYAEQQRKSKESLPHGERKLHAFYAALSAPKNTDEAGYLARIAQLEKWAAENPKSLTARVALAESWMRYGWLARGTGWANSVTREGWKLLEERLAKARKILADADELAEKDAEFYSVWLGVAFHSNEPANRCNELMEKGLVVDPKYYHLVARRAQHHMPRWGGKVNDVNTFAYQMSLRAELGVAIYARVVASMVRTYGVDILEEFTFDAERVWLGFQEIRKEFPQSNMNEHLHCYMACMTGNMAMARVLFPRLGGGWRSDVDGHETYQRFVWRNQFNYDRWRMLALANPGGQRQLIVPHRAALFSVAYSGTGTEIAVGGELGSVSLWDPKTLDRIEYFPRRKPPHVVTVAYPPSHPTLAFGGVESGVQFQNTNAEPRAIKGFKASVHQLAYVDDERLAAGCSDGTLRIWNIADLKPLHTISAHTGAVVGLAVARESPLVATAGADGKIHLWNPEDGTSSFTKKEIVQGLTAVALSPDGSTLAFSLYLNLLGSHVVLWDVMKNEVKCSMSGHKTPVRGLAFSPDGRRVATSEGLALTAAPCRILLWDVDPGNAPQEPIAQFLGHHSAIRGLAFSPDGKTLASASDDMTLRLWDVPE